MSRWQRAEPPRCARDCAVRSGVLLLRAVLCAALSSGAPARAAADVAFDCGSAQILGNELSRSEAEKYCSYTVSERAKVEAYWGASWRAPVRIHVSASYKISRALVPGHAGNRGLIEMPLRRVRERNSALLHEIVHVYAPADNRFLAEGLAVWLQATLGGNRAFPDFGEDLRSLAARNLRAVASLDALDAVRTPQPLGVVVDEKIAYALGGTFVGFLIERYGLERFRNLYRDGDYARALGKPLAVLEQEWRGSLRRE